MSGSVGATNPIKSLSDFLDRVAEEKKKEEQFRNYSDFIFRGQNIDRPLLPKLARINVNKNDLKSKEQSIFQEFKRLSPGFSDLSPSADWDLLALAQHYGLPTRLLDWSFGALTAAWFAVENEGRDEKGAQQDAVVWLLKTKPEDFIDLSMQNSKFVHVINNNKNVVNKSYNNISPFDNNRTRIYRPTAITRRISVQGGLFTVHQFRTRQEDFLQLDKNAKYKNRLIKFTFCSERCGYIKKELHGCGINRATLFPDLEGLCAHLAWRYFNANWLGDISTLNRSAR